MAFKDSMLLIVNDVDILKLSLAKPSVLSFNYVLTVSVLHVGWKDAKAVKIGTIAF